MVSPQYFATVIFPSYPRLGLRSPTTKIISSFLELRSSSKILNTNRRSSPETLPRLSKLVSDYVHVDLDAGYILSTAYNRATDRVSGKCASWYDVLRYAKSSGLQYIASTLVPKSIEELTEVCSLFSIHPASFSYRSIFRWYFCSSQPHSRKPSLLVSLQLSSFKRQIKVSSVNSG